MSDKILTDKQNARGAIEELRRDERYQELKRRLALTSFFEPDPYRFAVRCIVTQAVLLSSFLWLLSSPSWPVRLLGMALTGMAIVQGTFFAHEIDHGGVTTKAWLKELAGQYLMTVLCGYCYTYFRRDHALHHFHCQEEEHDPDMQPGLVGLYERAVQEKRGLARWLTRYQTIAVPLLYLLWAFNSKLESMAYVMRNPGKTRADQVGLALHFALWFGLGSWYFGPAALLLNYIGWVVFAGVYMGMIIPVNHVGTMIVRPGVRMPFLEQQILTSRNITGPRIMDFLFLGLNWQIEHHLFPWVPATRLRSGSEIVRQFCREHGLPYHEASYASATRFVWAHFRRMGMLTRSPAEIRSTAQESG